MRNTLLSAAALAAYLLAQYATAQDEQPAVDTSQPSKREAPATQQGYGMTILGERETPIGLFITPWRSSAPEHSVDRPAKLLDDALLPLDREVFTRFIEYDAALSEHRRAKAATSGLAE